METNRTAALDGNEVLVVERDDRLRRDVSCLLRRLGARVTTAVEGLEAVHAASTGAAAFAIVDLDVPDTGGPHLLRRLRRMSPRTRLVAIADVARRRALSVDPAVAPDAWVEKPFRAEDVGRLLLTLSGARDEVSALDRIEPAEGHRLPAGVVPEGGNNGKQL